MELRFYQKAAVEAVYDYLRARDDNPCVVIPTAGGKTPILATICRDAVLRWEGRVLVLAHVKELLCQAFDKLQQVDSDLALRIGLYSAGLKSRDTTHSIIVAGIQSVYQRAAELGAFDLIIVDEAHLIPEGGDGRYRTFLAEAKIVNPNVRVIGLTATPYRMSSGMICSSNNILNQVCYEIGVKELIVQGWICPVRSKGGKRLADFETIQVRGGEFEGEALQQAMDEDVLVESACHEIVERTVDRKSCLIFTSGIKHAWHVAGQLGELASGRIATIFGETSSEERSQTILDFKAGKIKYIVNVNVLTTGFDAPNIDCVVLLRPTLSPGLYYQMVGRGFRLFPGKSDCLVLDFGGNVIRHGPVDAIQTEKKENGEPPAKHCPDCQAIIAMSYQRCPDCGHEFPARLAASRKIKHDATASEAGVISGESHEITHKIARVNYYVHEKKKGDSISKSLRVDYLDNLFLVASEWVCVEHKGYAREKAEKWWLLMLGIQDPDYSQEVDAINIPATAEEACDQANEGILRKPIAITVRHTAGEHFDRIVDYQFAAPRLTELPPSEPFPEEFDTEDIPF